MSAKEAINSVDNALETGLGRLVWKLIQAIFMLAIGYGVLWADSRFIDEAEFAEHTTSTSLHMPYEDKVETFVLQTEHDKDINDLKSVNKRIEGKLDALIMMQAANGGLGIKP